MKKSEKRNRGTKKESHEHHEAGHSRVRRRQGRGLRLQTQEGRRLSLLLSLVGCGLVAGPEVPSSVEQQKALGGTGCWAYSVWAS
jgi:hypothetical protein